jgi:hypothetical protein
LYTTAFAGDDFSQPGDSCHNAARFPGEPRGPVPHSVASGFLNATIRNLKEV